MLPNMNIDNMNNQLTSNSYLPSTTNARIVRRDQERLSYNATKRIIIPYKNDFKYSLKQTIQNVSELPSSREEYLPICD